MVWIKDFFSAWYAAAYALLSIGLGFLALRLLFGLSRNGTRPRAKLWRYLLVLLSIIGCLFFLYATVVLAVVQHEVHRTKATDNYPNP